MARVPRLIQWDFSVQRSEVLWKCSRCPKVTIYSKLETLKRARHICPTSSIDLEGSRGLVRASKANCLIEILFLIIILIMIIILIIMVIIIIIMIMTMILIIMIMLLIILTIL